ncbi:hypothetical protein RB593_004289 [Gaeumannomyces tritici]
MQDDAPYPLSPRGPGALASMIKNRSATSLLHWRDDDEAAFDRSSDDDVEDQRARAEDRRMNALLNTPHMRSMRLIGRNNPRYQWESYWKTGADLKTMKKPIREYYERTNYLIQQYLYIDRLLDSSLPHDLLNEYNNMPASAFRGVEIPETISEESSTPPTTGSTSTQLASMSADSAAASIASAAKKVKRTPQDIYRHTGTVPLPLLDDREPDEEQPLLPKHDIPFIEDDNVDSSAPIVTLAIYVNFAANAFLLAGKIAVIISVPSVSVLASLVDAVLDFLSTVIVWLTTWLISHQDQYSYPVGRRRLEPLGVLVFSVIMITSFCQVSMEAIQHLASPDHEVIELGIPAISIMLSTVVIKGLCWFWCRLVKNSSVQALRDLQCWLHCLPHYWFLRWDLVDGCARRPVAVFGRGCELVPDLCRAHQEPLWLLCVSRPEEHLALLDHEVRQDHQADPRSSGLSFRRQAQRRGRYRARRQHLPKGQPRFSRESAIRARVGANCRQGLCAHRLRHVQPAHPHGAAAQLLGGLHPRLSTSDATPCCKKRKGRDGA